MRPRWPLLALVSALASCGPRARPPAPPDPPPGVRDDAWIGDYVCARDRTPLRDLVGNAFGELGQRARLEVLAEPAPEGSVRAHVIGPLEAWGVLDKSALGLRVAARASMLGPPRVHLAPGDVVQVLEPRARASVKIRARILPSDDPADPRDVSVDGELPSAALTADPVPEVAVGAGAFTPDWMSVPLLDAPGGQVVWTLPSRQGGHAVHLLERLGDWTHLAVGRGPYLDVWTRVGVAEGPVDLVDLRPAFPLALGQIGTLLCVQPETVVRAGERTLAKTHAATWARQLGKRDDDGAVKVRLATFSGVAVTGTIDAKRATAVATTQPRCP